MDGEARPRRDGPRFKTLDKDEARRGREETTISLRKDKRAEQLNKKRFGTGGAMIQPAQQIPSVGSQAWLEANPAALVEGVNSVFSAAALALFGTEDLWFVLRLVAKHDAAACPERYSDGLAHALGELSAAVDPDEALLALANATGVHFLLLGAADGGLPHAFRPADFVGKSKDQRAYVLARLPSSGGRRWARVAGFAAHSRPGRARRGGAR